MQTFLSDLLDLNQLNSGAFSICNQIFDPNEIFSLVVDVFEPQAKAKGIGILLEINDSDLDLQ